MARAALRKAGVTLAWALLAALPAGNSAAQNASAPAGEGAAIRAGVENGKIFASANLAPAITADTIKAISGGTPVTFTYTIQLMRDRPFLWDKVARQVVIKRIVKYDALKKTHLVWEKLGEAGGVIDFGAELKRVEYKPEPAERVPGAEKPADPPPPAAQEPGPSSVVMDPMELSKIRELETWMAATGKVDMGVWEGIPADSQYYIRIRLEVKSMNPFPPLRYLLFFYSFLDLDTGWKTSPAFPIPPKEKEAGAHPAPHPARHVDSAEAPR